MEIMSLETHKIDFLFSLLLNRCALEAFAKIIYSLFAQHGLAIVYVVLMIVRGCAIVWIDWCSSSTSVCMGLIRFLDPADHNITIIMMT